MKPIRNIFETYKVYISEVAELCLTFCDPMEYSLPGSSLHGILQARVLEWGAISLSRGSSRPRDRTQVSRIPGRGFNLWATREGQSIHSVQFSRSVVSDSLQPHESQHTRLPCPSPTPGVHQTHVHRVSDAIQPSHPLLSPLPPAPNLSQLQSLFQ